MGLPIPFGDGRAFTAHAKVGHRAPRPLAPRPVCASLYTTYPRGATVGIRGGHATPLGGAHAAPHAAKGAPSRGSRGPTPATRPGARRAGIGLDRAAKAGRAPARRAARRLRPPKAVGAGGAPALRPLEAKYARTTILHARPLLRRAAGLKRGLAPRADDALASRRPLQVQLERNPRPGRARQPQARGTAACGSPVTGQGRAQLDTGARRDGPRVAAAAAR